VPRSTLYLPRLAVVLALVSLTAPAAAEKASTLGKAQIKVIELNEPDGQIL